LGSGSTWPHDLRFLTGLPSELVGAGVEPACDIMSWNDESVGEGVSKGTWRSSILMVVGTKSSAGGVTGPSAIMVGVVMA
jgi:hypothetical protein